MITCSTSSLATFKKGQYVVIKQMVMQNGSLTYDLHGSWVSDEYLDVCAVKVATSHGFPI